MLPMLLDITESNNYYAENNIAITLKYSNNNNLKKNICSVGDFYSFDDTLIKLEYSDNNIITENILNSNADFGFYLDNSDSNRIEKHEIKECVNGMKLIYTEQNTIKCNNISYNDEFGIDLIESRMD